MCVSVHCSRCVCVCVCVPTAPGVCVCVCVCVCPLLQVCVCVCVSTAPGVCVSTAPSVCECVPTTPSVCALGWVKCREQNFTAGYTLYNYVCKNKNKKVFFFFTKPITDYGKMLKCREKYR